MEDMLGKIVEVGDFISYGGRAGGKGYSSVGIVKEIINSEIYDYTMDEADGSYEKGTVNVQYVRVRGLNIKNSRYSERSIELKSRDGFLGCENILVIDALSIPLRERTILRNNLSEFLAKESDLIC